MKMIVPIIILAIRVMLMLSTRPVLMLAIRLMLMLASRAVLTLAGQS